MRRLATITALAMLVALSAPSPVIAQTVPATASGHWTRNGVPPPPVHLVRECSWEQPRHGGAAESCTFRSAATTAEVTSYFARAFLKRGWLRADSWATTDGTGNHIRWTGYVRNDCGRDFAVESEARVMGRECVLEVTEYANGTRSLQLKYTEDITVEDLPCDLLAIARDAHLPVAQKRERLRVMQDSMGARAFAAAVRSLPVYDPEGQRLVTLHTMLRTMSREIDPDSHAPINDDPIGASVSIVMNPRMDNITKQVGLPWPP